MPDSLRGKFLIASRQIRDPNFYQTVVLMLEDNDESSMGLVINRPSSIAVDAAMDTLGAKFVAGDPIYSGGPVETAALFVMHNCTELGKEDEEICPRVFLTGSNESFEKLVSERDPQLPDCRFRIFCGYAGWSPGQLESERDRGDWYVLPGDSELVFSDHPYDVWETCMQRLHDRHKIVAQQIKDPEWN